VAPVFIPPIGFRPAGTRTLREPVGTTVDATQLSLVALAAAPGRTDVVIEWNRNGDPAVCSPESRILEHSNRTPLENGLAAELVIGANVLTAIAATRRAYHNSQSSIGATDAMSFPSIPLDVNSAELRMREGASHWTVPFALASAGVDATPVAMEAARGGVVIRATALARYHDELIVELEVEAATQIRQIAAPVPSPPHIPTDSDEDRRFRRAEMHRYFGAHAQPITLEDDRGGRCEEVRRLIWQEPQQATPGQRFTSRFSVVFDAPSAVVKYSTLVVPFVELNDFGPSATVELRTLPVDVALGGHHFRVAAVEPYWAGQRKLVLDLPPSAMTPRFVQPARVHGSDPEFGWLRNELDPESPDGRAIWMATKIGDPPIVTFKGVVLRVDGPLRLDLQLG
jgi:hypothetical protein